MYVGCYTDPRVNMYGESMHVGCVGRPLEGIFTEILGVMDLQEVCTVRVYQTTAKKIGITHCKSNLMGRFEVCFVYHENN